MSSEFKAEVACELGGYDQSRVFYADGGDPTLALPELPGDSIGLESFHLGPVIPAPAAWALMVVGATGWAYIARRRKGGSRPSRAHQEEL